MYISYVYQWLYAYFKYDYSIDPSSYPIPVIQRQPIRNAPRKLQAPILYTPDRRSNV